MMFGVDVENDMARAVSSAKNDQARNMATNSVMKRWLQIDSTVGQYKDPAK